MARSAGQESALSQLKAIEAAGDALAILGVGEEATAGGHLSVHVSLDLRGTLRCADGIPLRARERFQLFVPRDFPFDYPWVEVSHRRWAAFAHIQWGRHLCLYQAPDTDWLPSDGMFGLIDRLRTWIARAAVNELDEPGAPIHPPVAYVSNRDLPIVIPRKDVPDFPGRGWVGYAGLHVVSDNRVDVEDWLDLDQQPDGIVGAAILTSEPFPFEFPRTVADLVRQLDERGVPQTRLLSLLALAALHNPTDSPLFVFIGTPMRGIAGSGELQQHLAAWHLEPTLANGLRTMTAKYSENADLRALGAQMEALILEWAAQAKCEWLRIDEARPAVTVRRDERANVAAFQEKSVAIWGCGAIGGLAAECLARAGVRRLILIDNARVSQGVLVRQPFDDADIGDFKALALGKRLQRISPNLEIEGRVANLRDVLDGDDWLAEVDLILDAAASERVARKLEEKWRTVRRRVTPLLSLSVGRAATRGLLVYCPRGSSGAAADWIRKVKIELCRVEPSGGAVEDFWPLELPEPFQPEPGCSEPTFRGSYARLASLVGEMVEEAGARFSLGRAPSAAVLETHDDSGASSSRRFEFADDLVLSLPDGFEVRFAPAAWRDMRGWVIRSDRLRGATVETGGHLFGERDDAARVIWISHVSGPPPDSHHARSGFVCGTAGVVDETLRLSTRSRGAVRFIGLWHTHPGSTARPSETDVSTMANLVADAEFRSPQSLLVIVGGDLAAAPQVTAQLFTRSGGPDAAAPIVSAGLTQPAFFADGSALRRDVGLAFSGGGFRAVAFQLGTLRALHDRGVLARVSVVSGVSGGALLAALYAYGDEPFDQFDRRVQRILRRGLTTAVARRTLISRRTVEVAATWLGPGAAAFIFMAVRVLLGGLLTLSGQGRSRWARAIRGLQPPLRRWRSRSTAFEDVLRAELFGDTTLTDPRRDGLDIIINATELRSGTAFRFGSRHTSWRRRTLKDNRVSVAHAVAASAAYPILLPAFDEEHVFVERDGQEEKCRVVLSDGGLFDNLATSPLEPDRSSAISHNVFNPSFIVSCDAGRGAWDADTIPYWWPERASRAVDVIFKKSQDAVRDRLFRFAQSGQLRGMVLTYLGQPDEQLPTKPADLVTRAEVVDYPTDFSAMTPDDIERLALRGEQLTRLLLTHYCPEL